MKWYQWRYRGPYWLWAVLVVLFYAGLATLVDELAQGPAAKNTRASVTIEPVDQGSLQE